MEEKAFNNLKDTISTKCVSYFDPEWNTEVVVDASPVGLGAILCQTNTTDPSERRIVCFASRLLSDVEKRYSQCEKEALAVVWGCEKYWLYLIGRHFTLFTDNYRAVQLIFSNTRSGPLARIERMALRMSPFNCTIKHYPGETNVADYYSRHPCKAGVSAFLEELKAEQYVNMIVCADVPDANTLEEVIEATENDSKSSNIYKTLFSSNFSVKSHFILHGITEYMWFVFLCLC